MVTRQQERRRERERERMLITHLEATTSNLRVTSLLTSTRQQDGQDKYDSDLASLLRILLISTHYINIISWLASRRQTLHVHSSYNHTSLYREANIWNIKLFKRVREHTGGMMWRLVEFKLWRILYFQKNEFDNKPVAIYFFIRPITKKKDKW